MDFSVLLNDLRDVAEKYKGQTSEPQVSTLAYVDMFTKILKRAQKVTEEYDDQITVLWVALNQLASIYKDLSAGTARDQLCKFIFGMCAKTVLNIQWAQLDEDSRVKNNFSTTVEDVHKILSQLGFQKFQLILDLMESHWTHPMLSKIMSGEEEDTEDCLEYIQKEDPDILKLRIEIMMKENCEEFALNLCTWSLKHPQLLTDLKIKEHQIFMLYKQQEYGKMQEVCETIVCHDGIRVMSHLAKTPTNQELCIRLAQVFLIQDWMRPEQTCCTQELLKLWIHHQYLADKDEERFLDSIWTVAKVCRDTEQIGVLIDGVKKECGDMFIQLYSELCKYAINIDKGNMERQEVQQDKVEYDKRRLAMSKTCVRMAFMLKEYDFRMSRICGLTAFSLDPTTENLNLVNKLYWTIKNVSATSQNSRINIATLYEIERLLGQIRPEVLNPDYSWKQLIPVCKKYKIDFHNGKYGLPCKIEAVSHSQSTSFDFAASQQTTQYIQSDKDITKDIDTGQKCIRIPRQYEIPKNIQKTHLAKLLKEKKVTNDEIERVLAKEFPRNVSQGFDDAPSLDVKELDKTISDLKKSIDLETQYRQLLKQNLSTLHHSSDKSDNTGNALSCIQDKDISRQEQLRQQQHVLESKNRIVHRQHSAPSGTQTQGPILHKQLSVGIPQPPHAHSHHRQQQMSPVAAFGGSPPPAHSSSPRMSSPTGFQSPLSPPSFRPHTPSPAILKKSRKSSSKNTSQSRSETITKLCNKIQGGLQKRSQQSKPGKNSHMNILRPPGNPNQECAQIAQQIAEMHEKQRAERLVAARLQGHLEGMKAALNSRNIPSRSQISDLLSLTFQGNKTPKVDDSQKHLISKLQESELNMGKSYLKKKIASAASTPGISSPQNVQRSTMHSSNTANGQNSSFSSPKATVENQGYSTELVQDVKQSDLNESLSNVLVPGEQGWDASRGIMKQKYYYKAPVPKGSGVKGNKDDPPLNMKPVYSMIVPKELTNPNRKEDLVKTVTSMMKQFPKGIQHQPTAVTSSLQSDVSTQAVVRVQNQHRASQSQHADITQEMQSSSTHDQGIASSSVPGTITTLNSQTNVHSGVPVSSQPISQNVSEDGLLNLNTLAAASVSVLGQNPNQHQLLGSLQVAQPVQQQHMFSTTIVEPQTLYSPLQPVQPVLQGQETILATPLYTMSAPVIPESVLTQHLPDTQVNDGSMQQPLIQQIVSGQNQAVAINNSPQIVNIVSQQSAFQVTSVEQVANLVGVSQPLTGVTTLMSAGNNRFSTGSSNFETNVMAVPMENFQPLCGDVTQPMTNVSTGSLSCASAEPVTHKPFINAPELSPALVRQILTSLKKGGLKGTQDNRSNSGASSKECKKDQKQSQVPVGSLTSMKEIVKDNVKQNLATKHDPSAKQGVNEAQQKILELRKQFGQSDLPSLNCKDLASATRQDVSTSVHNSSTSRRQSSSYLERLMSDDQDLNQINGNVPSFLTPSQTSENISNINRTTCYQQVIPDLPDLGAKEFQIDSLLALESESSSIHQNEKCTEQTRAVTEANLSVVTKHDVSLEEANDSVQNRFQVKMSSNAPHQQTEQSDTVPKHDSRQEYTASQSTYYNANRLGKEREHRELKERNNVDGKQQEIKTQDSQLQKKSHPDKKSFCANCDRSFPTAQHLLDHKEKSNCDSKWQCSFCKMTFHSPDILKTHEKNYCLKSPSPVVKCPNCGLYFQSHEQVKTHLSHNTCTPKTISDGKKSVEEIVCGICERKFETMTAIKEHVKIGCFRKDSKFSISTEREPQDSDFSLVFKCTKCNFMNVNENIVSKHVEKCKENNAAAELTKLYQCNMCEETLCDHQDVLKHVTRQCPKLKVATSQRQVQDNYERLNNSNISKLKGWESEKSIEAGDKTEKGIEIKNEEKNQNCKQEKKQFTLPKSSETNIKEVKTTTVEKPKIAKVSGRRTSKVIKATAVVKNKIPDSRFLPILPRSEDEIAFQVQKEQRISAENQFLAEFNAMEKRKQALRMMKQNEFEEQNDLFDELNVHHFEGAQKSNLSGIKRNLELLKEQQNKLDTEIGKQPLLFEKKTKEMTQFENEKRKHINTILGNTSLQQKMKEDIEKQRRDEQSKDAKRREEVESLFSACKVEKKEMVSLNCYGTSKRVKREQDLMHTVSEQSQIKKNAVNSKLSRIMRDKDNFNTIKADLERDRKDHIQINKKRPRSKDSLTKERSHVQYRNVRKQKSPQDIRKIKGLRAKRLIKRQKFFIENFEMGPSRRANKSLNSWKDKSHIADNISEIGKSKDEKDQIEPHIKDETATEEIIGSSSKICQEMEKYRVICKFCGYQNSENFEILNHYIQIHKLGFRFDSYSYFCNYCNQRFRSTQTKHVKDHVYQNHIESVFKRIVQGKYDKKVWKNKPSPDKTRRTTNKQTHKHNTRRSNRLHRGTCKASKHSRAIALREKCAEKLRIIALARKNAVINYSECDDETSDHTPSNNSTDNESREARIADVNAKISLLSGEKKEKGDLGSRPGDGRRIAPRLARKMIKDGKIRDKNMERNEMKTSEMNDSSDARDSSDGHVLTRSRSSSISSNRSSLNFSSKKRKSAIAVSTRTASHAQQRKLNTGDKLLLTRSGRAVKRPEIEYDKSTESSGLGSGEDNSEYEESKMRRKSTRVRRLSERGKLYRDKSSETDESSTEEVKPMITRQSLISTEVENETAASNSGDTDQSHKRSRKDSSQCGRLMSENGNVKKIKTNQSRETAMNPGMRITRQNSKNVEESDSETESNYTDIDKLVLEGVKPEDTTSEGSAESDSESTSLENIWLNRKYRLRKRSLHKQYKETDSSEDEENVKKSRNRYKNLDKVDEDSDFEPSKECDEFPADDATTRKTNKAKLSCMGQVSDYSESGTYVTPGNFCGKEEPKVGKPKVVLIGAEEDDDLNVDYEIDCPLPASFQESHEQTANTSEQFSSMETNVPDSANANESKKVDSCIDTKPKARTILLSPDDEFADLKSSENTPKSCPLTTCTLTNDSETVYKEPSHSSAKVEVPATIMDDDEFEFLKYEKVCTNETIESSIEKLSSSFGTPENVAFDTEFIKYTKTEKNVDDSESERDSDELQEVETTENNAVRAVLKESNSEIDIPLLPEDVPVLPPRDISQGKDLKNDYSQKRNEPKGNKTEKLKMDKHKPILKAARVVIEDISVIKKALEEEITAKKLKEECEASNCKVKIDRLSKEDIEKHLALRTDVLSMEDDDGNNVNDEGVILIDDSDVEQLALKKVMELEYDSEENVVFEETGQKQKGEIIDSKYTVKLQDETLIQDIILDNSVINQLLSSATYAVHEITHNVPVDEVETYVDTTDIVQIVVEDGISYDDRVLAVDAKSNTNAEKDRNTVIESNNIIIVVNNVEDNILESNGGGNKTLLDIESQNSEDTEEVWVENAESYAEIPKKTEYEQCPRQTTKVETAELSDPKECINSMISVFEVSSVQSSISTDFSDKSRMDQEDGENDVQDNLLLHSESQDVKRKEEFIMKYDAKDISRDVDSAAPCDMHTYQIDTASQEILQITESESVEGHTVNKEETDTSVPPLCRDSPPRAQDDDRNFETTKEYVSCVLNNIEMNISASDVSQNVLDMKEDVCKNGNSQDDISVEFHTNNSSIEKQEIDTECNSSVEFKDGSLQIDTASPEKIQITESESVEDHTVDKEETDTSVPPLCRDSLPKSQDDDRNFETTEEYVSCVLNNIEMNINTPEVSQNVLDMKGNVCKNSNSEDDISVEFHTNNSSVEKQEIDTECNSYVEFIGGSHQIETASPEIIQITESESVEDHTVNKDETDTSVPPICRDSPPRAQDVNRNSETTKEYVSCVLSNIEMNINAPEVSQNVLDMKEDVCQNSNSEDDISVEFHTNNSFVETQEKDTECNSYVEFKDDSHQIETVSPEIKQITESESVEDHTVNKDQTVTSVPPLWIDSPPRAQDDNRNSVTTKECVSCVLSNIEMNINAPEVSQNVLDMKDDVCQNSNSEDDISVEFHTNNSSVEKQEIDTECNSYVEFKDDSHQIDTASPEIIQITESESVEDHTVNKEESVKSVPPLCRDSPPRAQDNDRNSETSKEYVSCVLNNNIEMNISASDVSQNVLDMKEDVCKNGNSQDDISVEFHTNNSSIEKQEIDTECNSSVEFKDGSLQIDTASPEKIQITESESVEDHTVDKEETDTSVPPLCRDSLPKSQDDDRNFETTEEYVSCVLNNIEMNINTPEVSQNVLDMKEDVCKNSNSEDDASVEFHTNNSSVEKQEIDTESYSSVEFKDDSHKCIEKDQSGSNGECETGIGSEKSGESESYNLLESSTPDKDIKQISLTKVCNYEHEEHEVLKMANNEREIVIPSCLASLSSEVDKLQRNNVINVLQGKIIDDRKLICCRETTVENRRTEETVTCIFESDLETGIEKKQSMVIQKGINLAHTSIDIGQVGCLDPEEITNANDNDNVIRETELCTARENKEDRTQCENEAVDLASVVSVLHKVATIPSEISNNEKPSPGTEFEYIKEVGSPLERDVKQSRNTDHTDVTFSTDSRPSVLQNPVLVSDIGTNDSLNAIQNYSDSDSDIEIITFESDFTVCTAESNVDGLKLENGLTYNSALREEAHHENDRLKASDNKGIYNPEFCSNNLVLKANNTEKGDVETTCIMNDDITVLDNEAVSSFSVGKDPAICDAQNESVTIVDAKIGGLDISGELRSSSAGNSTETLDSDDIVEIKIGENIFKEAWCLDIVNNGENPKTMNETSNKDVCLQSAEETSCETKGDDEISEIRFGTYEQIRVNHLIEEPNDQKSTFKKLIYRGDEKKSINVCDEMKDESDATVSSENILLSVYENQSVCTADHSTVVHENKHTFNEDDICELSVPMANKISADNFQRNMMEQDEVKKKQENKFTVVDTCSEGDLSIENDEIKETVLTICHEKSSNSLIKDVEGDSQLVEIRETIEKQMQSMDITVLSCTESKKTVEDIPETERTLQETPPTNKDEIKKKIHSMREDTQSIDLRSENMFLYTENVTKRGPAEKASTESQFSEENENDIFVPSLTRASSSEISLISTPEYETEHNSTNNDIVKPSDECIALNIYSNNERSHNIYSFQKEEVLKSYYLSQEVVSESTCKREYTVDVTQPIDNETIKEKEETSRLNYLSEYEKPFVDSQVDNSTEYKKSQEMKIFADSNVTLSCTYNEQAPQMTKKESRPLKCEMKWKDNVKQNAGNVTELSAMKASEQQKDPAKVAKSSEELENACESQNINVKTDDYLHVYRNSLPGLDETDNTDTAKMFESRKVNSGAFSTEVDLESSEVTFYTKNEGKEFSEDTFGDSTSSNEYTTTLILRETSDGISKISELSEQKKDHSKGAKSNEERENVRDSHYGDVYKDNKETIVQEHKEFCSHVYENNMHELDEADNTDTTTKGMESKQVNNRDRCTEVAVQNDKCTFYTMNDGKKCSEDTFGDNTFSNEYNTTIESTMPPETNNGISKTELLGEQQKGKSKEVKISKGENTIDSRNINVDKDEKETTQEDEKLYSHVYENSMLGLDDAYKTDTAEGIESRQINNSDCFTNVALENDKNNPYTNAEGKESSEDSFGDSTEIYEETFEDNTSLNEHSTAIESTITPGVSAGISKQSGLSEQQKEQPKDVKSSEVQDNVSDSQIVNVDTDEKESFQEDDQLYSHVNKNSMLQLEPCNTDTGKGMESKQDNDINCSIEVPLENDTNTFFTTTDGLEFSEDTFGDSTSSNEYTTTVESMMPLKTSGVISKISGLSKQQKNQSKDIKISEQHENVNDRHDIIVHTHTQETTQEDEELNSHVYENTMLGFGEADNTGAAKGMEGKKVNSCGCATEVTLENDNIAFYTNDEGKEFSEDTLVDNTSTNEHTTILKPSTPPETSDVISKIPELNREGSRKEALEEENKCNMGVEQFHNDSSIDKCVKENEEKRKVFEAPSPRRKGMIVGRTCVMKKPTNPFIKTQSIVTVSEGESRISNPPVENKCSTEIKERNFEEQNKFVTEIEKGISSTSSENDRKPSENLSEDKKITVSTHFEQSDHNELEVNPKTKNAIASTSEQGKGKYEYDEKVVEEKSNEYLQLENETDEDFRRRTETVRCARRKSAVKPYESDFNFEDGESKQPRQDAIILPSTSFWPSDSDNKLENFDTASLYSTSSSGSSTNVAAVKEGTSKVMARCVRDFGIEDLKQKILPLPPVSKVPVFTCTSPEKSTVSSMAVKIVRKMGASAQSTQLSNKDQNTLRKYTVPHLTAPMMTTKLKMLDKNVLSNTQRIVKVATLKSMPNISKGFTLTTANLGQTFKTLTARADIGKNVKKAHVLGACNIEKKETQSQDIDQSHGEHSGSTSSVGAYEPSEDALSKEKMTNKTKALRALHKKDKPFRWESTPSPPKQLRSQSKEIRNKGDEKLEKNHSDKTTKNKTDDRNENEKDVLQQKKSYETLRSLRTKKKKETADLSKRGHFEKDMSDTNQNSDDGRLTRGREMLTKEKGIRTRSRSGSKDNTKTMEERRVKKTKSETSVQSKRKDKEITVGKKKQSKDKAGIKQPNVKFNDGSVVTIPRRSTDGDLNSTRILRNTSTESGEVKKCVGKRKSETDGSDRAKTKMQKGVSKLPCTSEPISNEIPKEKVCKLDGTSNSPEKSESEVPNQCAHKLNIPGCDNCSDMQVENETIENESNRPAVRQIIHKGKVIEIQRGCVTETDIRDFKTKANDGVNDASNEGDKQVKTRSKAFIGRRKRVHSPTGVTATKMKSRRGTVGMMDINKYISQTLIEIKKQRDNSSRNKWTVRQKKRTKDPFPYSFKKANSKP